MDCLLSDIEATLEKIKSVRGYWEKCMGFEAIGIISRNLKTSVQFYQLLGMEFKEGGNSNHLECQLPNGIRIMMDSADLIQQINPHWKHQAGTGPALCFRQDTPQKVDALYKKLIEFGVKAVQEPWDAFWGHRYACVQDPDGNQIDLFADL